jgi:ABC-type transporter Mla MlaB component
MALGKNMKVDRLIPLKKEDKALEAIPPVAQEEITPAVSVSLDEFFENLTSNEAVKATEVTPENTESSEPSTIYTDVVLEDLTLNFKPSRRKTQRRMIISLEGNLTIKHVELLYSKVHSVFENYDIAEINLTNISDIDITVIQLFHAIRVHFYPLNKFIAIQADLSREDRKLLNTCGFTEFQS